MQNHHSSLPPPRTTLDQARHILLPRMPTFATSLGAAFERWNEVYASRQMALDPAAQAFIINNEFYFEANARFAADSGVVFDVKQLQKFFIVDQRLIVRFKLLHDDLNSRNYPTRHARDWTRQYPLNDLELPTVDRLTLGYRFDLTRTLIRDAFVTLPNGDPEVVNDWVWQIWGNPVDLTTFGIQLPLMPPGQQPSRVYAYDNFEQEAA